jgi:cobalt-zinc-cadmium efflux system outer membrane protein
VLTLDAAFARARERAPQILSARAAIGEARGRLTGASPLLHDNPSLTSTLGRRRTLGEQIEDRVFGISQGIELGGQRGARIASARADIERATADRDDVTRTVLGDVGRAFVAALAARERLALAASAESIAVDLAHTAERRYAVEDVPVLDVNLAQIALARARADRNADEAGLSEALGALRVILALPMQESLSVQGDLAAQRIPPLDTLLASAARRPDARALSAATTAAEADRRLGRSLRWPDLTLQFEQGHEEGAEILRGGVGLTVPLFDRGQGTRAEAAARAQRLHGETTARRQSIETSVRTAFAVYEARMRAAEQLGGLLLNNLQENEDLTRRSYAAGQLSLAEVLLFRREMIETRRASIDRMEDAALAAFDLLTAAGRLP